ncbi:MAG: aspartyl protease family protein [Polyangia bacterium]
MSLFTGHWGVVEMSIGKVTGRFLLDTGTDHTVIDVSLAKRAGWAISDCKALPGTIFGDLCRVALPASTVAGHRLPPASGRTADMRQSDLGQMTSVDGYLGGDGLGKFVVVFDYPVRQCGWSRSRFHEDAEAILPVVDRRERAMEPAIVATRP